MQLIKRLPENSIKSKGAHCSGGIGTKQCGRVSPPAPRSTGPGEAGTSTEAAFQPQWEAFEYKHTGSG